MNWPLNFTGTGAIVLVVLASVNVLLIVMGIRRFRASDIAMCGNCRHAIHAMDSGRCAECGSMYVDAGVQAGLVRPGFPTWLIAAIVLLVSGVFIYAARGLASRAIDVDLPLSTSSYMSSNARNLDTSLFTSKEGEDTFFVRLVFTKEKSAIEDEFAHHYEWTPVPSQLELTTITGEKEYSLNAPLVLHEDIDESEVRPWLLEAGAIDSSEAGDTRFEELLQQIVIDGNHFRNDEEGDYLSGFQVNYATMGGMIKRKAWISTTMDVSVFVLFGGVVLLLVAWAKRRSRRLREAHGS